MNPVVSIIIPTYNRAGIITKTLASVIGQTFSDWECLIVDDHSTDNTDEIIRESSIRDSRITYYRNERKKGAQGARNTGLYNAKSDWVFFFDSDNVMHPELLQKLTDRIDDNIDVVTCFSDIVDVEKGCTGRTLGSVNEGNIHDKLFTGQCYVDFNHAIIRKSKLLQICGLDEDCPSMQEWDTHIRLSNHAVYTTVPERLVDYYIGGKDAISTDKKREVVGRLYILRKHGKEWKSYHDACVGFVGQIRQIIKMNDDVKFKHRALLTLFQNVPEAFFEMQCRRCFGYCRRLIKRN